jgi:NAD-specific glutamate dehydrogenase
VGVGTASALTLFQTATKSYPHRQKHPKKIGVLFFAKHNTYINDHKYVGTLASMNVHTYTLLIYMSTFESARNDPTDVEIDKVNTNALLSTETPKYIT